MERYDFWLLVALLELWRLVTYRVATVVMRAWASAYTSRPILLMFYLRFIDINLMYVAHKQASMRLFLASRHCLWVATRVGLSLRQGNICPVLVLIVRCALMVLNQD